MELQIPKFDSWCSGFAMRNYYTRARARARDGVASSEFVMITIIHLGPPSSIKAYKEGSTLLNENTYIYYGSTTFYFLQSPRPYKGALYRWLRTLSLGRVFRIYFRVGPHGRHFYYPFKKAPSKNYMLSGDPRS